MFCQLDHYYCLFIYEIRGTVSGEGWDYPIFHIIVRDPLIYSEKLFTRHTELIFDKFTINLL